MMTKPIKRLPALGQAWSGDWRARVRERLSACRFDSVASFAESMPTASTVELADELSTDREVGIDRADVAAEQLVRLWRDEAQRAGRDAIERFSRRILVGELHYELPDGWRADWTAADAGGERRAALSRLASASATWTCSHSDEYRPATDRVFKALLDEGRAGKIPPGWLPVNADDPLLVAIFERYWREPK